MTDARFVQRAPSERRARFYTLAKKITPCAMEELVKIVLGLVVEEDLARKEPTLFHPHTEEVAGLVREAISRPLKEVGKRLAAVDHALDRYMDGETHYYGMEAEVAEFTESPVIKAYPSTSFDTEEQLLDWATGTIICLSLHHMDATGRLSNSFNRYVWRPRGLGVATGQEEK